MCQNNKYFLGGVWFLCVACKSHKERVHANKYAYNFKCNLMDNTLLNERRIRAEAKQADPMLNLIIKILSGAGSNRIFSSFSYFQFPRILAVGSGTFLKAGAINATGFLQGSCL